MSGPRRRAKKRGVRGSRSRGGSHARRLALGCGIALSALYALLAILGCWFVHHPKAWIDAAYENSPVTASVLLWAGNPIGDLTDALGWTGHDVVYDYDAEIEPGTVCFAGTPVRRGAPAPDDITVLDRGEFKVGWSPKLRHPVWVAYHVPATATFPEGKRPNFTKDRDARESPPAAAYDKSGYDRGHMAPNHALVTRFGEEVQKRTFLMSNIAPQLPQLNRGVWREFEHRIADLWTARWGEIWVVVGCISDDLNETLSGTNIDVPRQFYQIVLAQEGTLIRALAVLFDQDVPWKTWPTRHLVSIDELERRTGLDFMPELESFMEPLEAELPTRLWPIRWRDIFSQIALRFN
ncbi:MAG: DNA/RNA non-specific endonuclease [Kiritimatiellia bacterium]